MGDVERDQGVTKVYLTVDMFRDKSTFSLLLLSIREAAFKELAFCS